MRSWDFLSVIEMVIGLQKAEKKNQVANMAQKGTRDGSLSCSLKGEPDRFKSEIVVEIF